MTLTRYEHDLLIKYCPNWMELRWPGYRKQWFIGGMCVSGTSADMENLQHQLDYAKECSAAGRIL